MSGTRPRSLYGYNDWHSITTRAIVFLLRPGRYPRDMRGVLLSVPPAMLEERRRLGIDGRDEMWDGVVHVVPPAGDAQQEVQSDLFPVLQPLAKARGLVARFETGLYRATDDYKVPDQLFCRPDQRSQRGAEGAELVVEVRSPGDETYEKIDWYAARGVREMLIIHPEGRRFELLRAVGGRLLPVSADAGGVVRCEVLALGLATVDEKLVLTWDGGITRI